MSPQAPARDAALPGGPAAGRVTVGTAIGHASALLKAAGVRTPRLDTEVLLAHLLSGTREDVYTRWDEPLPAPVVERLSAWVQRRCAREPVAYIVGHREFWSLDLLVTRDVLIPRPETELLVEEAAKASRAAGRPVRILDLGTGSGAVAIALAVEVPHARLVATDRSPAAVAVARQNAVRHGVEDRVEVRCGEGFAPVAGEARTFDALVCNPPYLARRDLTRLDPEVREFEPLDALVAGEEGTEVIKRVLAETPAHVTRRGLVLMEIGDEQMRAVERMVVRSGDYATPLFIRDLAGIERVLRVRLAR